MKLHTSLVVLFLFSFIPLLYSQQVGLVLSGGGAKGIAHVGLIKALEENNIPIDYVTGTSIGAIVGGLYAMGYSAEEMKELFCSEKFLLWQTGQVEEDYIYYFKKPEDTPEFVKFKIGIKDSSSFVPLVLPKSLINPIQLNYVFMEMFATATAVCKGNFDDLFVPFRCVASDINKKRAVVFDSGDMGDAVRASMSFPFVFKSIKIDSVLLFDGGIYDNFPVQPMKESFDPDFIIGSVVTSKTEDTQMNEDNLFDQLETMIMQKTHYRLRRQDGDGIIVRYELKGMGLLDFDKSEELYRIGYEQGLQYVDSIKKKVHREVLEEDVELKRMIYKSHLQNLVFKNVHITGANSAQQEYIENAIHRSGQKFTLEEFKTSYFKLLADSKISEIIPHAVYNPEEKCFDLNLEVIMDENVIISFGGNISSSNSNQAFLGIGYQSLSKYAINYDLQGNFGDANNSVMLSGRVELPTRSIPMYLRLMGVFMNQKYYNSDNLFYTEDVLAFIRQKDIYVKMRLGFPFLMRGKAEISLGYGELRDYYYQSNNVSFAETDFDKSRYKLGVGTFRIEHNSLNNKMYATEGLSWYMLAQLVAGTEYYKSAPVKLEGGVTEITHEKKDHSWMQIKGVVRNYNTLSSEFNLGYHLESVIAGKNFFNNYTSTVLQASAFQPTPHSKTSFNEKLRANQYFAGGLIPIWKINRLFHLRGEFYAFLPFNEIIRTEDNKASQGKFLRDFQYLGEASLVCQLPFMSIAVFANKYSYPDNNWNFGLNIGYLIFNSRLIEQ